MKLKKYALCIFVIIMFCFINNSVYGYNLKFEADIVGTNESNKVLKFYISTKASNRSIRQYNDYKNYCKGDPDWGYLMSSKNKLPSNSDGLKTCSDVFDPNLNQPTQSNYIAKGYNFYKYTNDNDTITNYHSSNSGLSQPYIKVSYLKYKDVISPNKGDYINSEEYDQSFISIAGNNQLPSNIINIPAKKVRSGMLIRDNTLDEDYITIDNNYIEELEHSIDASIATSEKSYIRYSPSNWTKFQSYITRPSYSITSSTNSNMDSAWKFYSVTQMTGKGSAWSPYTKGCSNYGNGNTSSACNDPKTYASNSAVNEYDNILVISNPQKKRMVYVRHIDAATGQLIPNAQNTKSVNGIAVSGSSISYAPNNLSSQENYSIATNQAITLGKTKLTQVNGKNIEYLGYKKGINVNKDTAISTVANAGGYSTGDTVNIPASNQVDYTFVDFYYNTNAAITPHVDLKGRLLFKSNDDGYDDSTRDSKTDYIPSGKSVYGYISGAYPYLLNNLTYRIEDQNIVVQYKTYHYEYWRETSNWDKVDNAIDEKTKKPKIIDGKSYHWKFIGYSYNDNHYPVLNENTGTYKYYDDDRLNYKEYTHTIENTHTVTIPIKYYNVANISMWKVNNAKVEDKDSDEGGKLFNNDEYNISTSSDYRSRSSINITQPKATAAVTCSDVASSSNNYEHNTNCTINVNVANSYSYMDGGKQIIEDKGNKAATLTLDDGASTLSRTLSLVDATLLTNTYDSNTKYFVAPTKTVSDNATLADSNPLGLQYTGENDFDDNDIAVPEEKVNGIRNPWGNIKYALDNNNNGSGLSYTASGSTVVGQSTNGLVQEAIQEAKYRLNYSTNTMDKDLKNMKDVGDDEGDKANNKVNVLTPIALTNPIINTDKYVDHSSNSNDAIIQKDSYFTITPQTTTSSVADYDSVGTYEFVKNFYIKLTFDVVDAKIVNSSGREVEKIGNVTNGAVVKIPKGDSFNAKSVNYTGSIALSQISNNVRIMASAYNIPDSLEDDIVSRNQYAEDTDYMDEDSNNEYTGGDSRQSSYYPRSDIINDAFHMIYFDQATTNLSRIYDFKVTDCADVNWKNVFRNLTNDGKINSLTGKVYYAGINKWDMTSGVSENEIKLRDDLGKASYMTPLRTLPLGPYKHDPITYLNAPKLGYRFSFDLKTTGYLSGNAKRYIQITPSYYYISKDGKSFDKDIDIYYKNSTNKYVPFSDSSYNLYFTPNDGYRNTYNEKITPVIDGMSKKLEELTIGKTFTLTEKMMSTSYDKFVQAWYGEFKLPNSTIAIKKGTKNITENAIKKDGYIGVVFTINCIDIDAQNGKLVRTTSYNQNDKKASSTTNTTEWDYEGFLGFRSPGSNAELTLQLEKGTWYIYNDTYNTIKGTVILYDTDARAAQDYD